MLWQIQIGVSKCWVVNAIRLGFAFILIKPEQQAKHEYILITAAITFRNVLESL